MDNTTNHPPTNEMSSQATDPKKSKRWKGDVIHVYETQKRMQLPEEEAHIKSILSRPQTSFYAACIELAPRYGISPTTTGRLIEELKYGAPNRKKPEPPPAEPELPLDAAPPPDDPPLPTIESRLERIEVLLEIICKSFEIKY